MRRFRFRLESVLKWRQLQLELEEEKLQERFSELRRLHERRAALETGQADAERAVLMAPTVPAEELAALNAHRRWVNAQRERLAQAILDCQHRTEEQRGRVRKAEQNLRLLEKLKERRLAEWSAAADKEHQLLAEECFLSRWQRGG